MNKLIGFLIVVAIATTLAWQNRVDLLVWGLPIVKETLSPVPENVPITWPAGPEVATAPANDRAPNIILILTDDMGFNERCLIHAN